MSFSRPTMVSALIDLHDDSTTEHFDFHSPPTTMPYCPDFASITANPVLSTDEESVVSAARALLSLDSPRLEQASAPPSPPPMTLSTPTLAIVSSPPSLVRASDDCWFGRTSLALPSDEEALSPVHCFMRRYCVEAFAATEEDLASLRCHKIPGNGVQLGQVGIRCLHCLHRPPDLRQERAVCFPSTLKNIYHSIETWQRRHSVVCRDIPTWVKKDMLRLIEVSRTGAGGRRQYWEESAKQLGMVDTADGIRFSRSPGAIASVPTLLEEHSDVEEEPRVPVVTDYDRETVTPSLFLLLDQMELCHFTEQDRAGGRSKIKDCPVGFPGIQCKHCRGKAGFGRYFPTSVGALTSANSDRNILNHLLKCRKCPYPIREQLTRQDESSKNRRGSRKVFFERIWSRIHAD